MAARPAHSAARRGRSRSAGAASPTTQRTRRSCCAGAAERISRALRYRRTARTTSTADASARPIGDGTSCPRAAITRGRAVGRRIAPGTAGTTIARPHAITACSTGTALSRRGAAVRAAALAAGTAQT